MADDSVNPDESLTEEEIFGQDAPRKKPKTALNAFQQLMKPKPKPKPAEPDRSTGGNPFRNRMGLGEYLDDPASFPASVVIAHDPDFVVIHDKFPKATVHTLILPRSPSVNMKHPFDALEDPAFLAQVRSQAEEVKKLVAAELQRKLGADSRSEKKRQEVLDGKVDADEIPEGRDWLAEVKCGVHAVPSMTHLHVHVLSRDSRSTCVRHKKHYNSFNTPFLVPLEDFPLAEDDPRRNTREHRYLARDLVCWRCGQNFGNKFTKLKEHLEEEFLNWKAE